MAAQSPSVSSEFLESLTKISRKLRTVFNQRVTAQGLTYPRARVLIRLARHSGCTQRALACELELEQPTLVRILDRMGELDLITREPDPEDRRAKHIVLTEHGREQAALVKRLGDEVREELFHDMDEADLRMAVDFLERVGVRLNEASASSAQGERAKLEVGNG